MCQTCHESSLIDKCTSNDRLCGGRAIGATGSRPIRGRVSNQTRTCLSRKSSVFVGQPGTMVDGTVMPLCMTVQNGLKDTAPALLLGLADSWYGQIGEQARWNQNSNQNGTMGALESSGAVRLGVVRPAKPGWIDPAAVFGDLTGVAKGPSRPLRRRLGPGPWGPTQRPG